MKKGELCQDGSVYGETFSGEDYNLGYPETKDNETYAQYRERVNTYKSKGFHLGDLSWRDWDIYCKGSGYFEGVDSDWIY